MSELTIQLLPLATGAVTALAGWLIGRRERNAKTTSIEVSSVKEAVEIWSNTAEDLREQYRILQNSFEGLKEDYNHLKDDYRRLEKENQNLRKRVRSLEKENETLKRES